ncbi:MAG TPA: hypothetical protein VGM82_05250 [Gemmatimonadaceae bacterium]|jgi:hypothetical protein
MTFPGEGMKVGGILTLEEVRARQQWEVRVANQLHAQKLREALIIHQQQEEIAKLEANPTNKNVKKLQGMERAIANAAAIEAACQRLELDESRLKDSFTQFLIDCDVATAKQELDEQIEGRDRLTARYSALTVVLDAHKAAMQSFAYQNLQIQFGRVVRAWAYLEHLIKSRVEAERKAWQEARQRAREAELDLEYERAAAREKAHKAKGAKPAKSTELPVLTTPADIVGASATALAIYTWAYGHAMDATHSNWRSAYNDPLNRPLGPSYPATETITFPGGIRNIVSNAPRLRVSLAVADEVSRLWAGQRLEVTGGPLGTTRYLCGATAWHAGHINLVMEGGNAATGASVMNLHVWVI